MVYFASWQIENIDSAVMITASHNPAEYNGMKFCLKDAVPIGEGSGMEEIRDFACQGKFEMPTEKGKIEELPNFKETYLEYMMQFFKAGKSKKESCD